MKMLCTRWQDVDWASVKSKVFEWQQIIYSASKSGDIKIVRKYQSRIMGSIDAKLFAVRSVTQDNKGKRISGIDKIKTIAADFRFDFAKSLVIPSKASSLRWVWISESGELEKKRLGIPTVKDRCLQALFKLALEPEWEAKFEKDSYGFRPGRNPVDAIAAIRFSIQKRPKYVLVADISKRFDRISHHKLLDKIGMIGKFRTQLKYWLKSGILYEFVFLQTDLGASQCSVMAPLLANIALHGMEEFCEDLIKDIPVYGSTGKLIKKSRRGNTLGFVRYAGNFVLMHPDLEVIALLQNKIAGFLRSISLGLIHIKTYVSHTLEIKPDAINICPGLAGKPGFDFLGFYIRSHKTRHLTACGPSGEKLGFRTLIIPSKEERNLYQSKLHDIVLKRGKRLSQTVLILKLNTMIRCWANYFGKSDANMMGLLGQMDYLLYLKVRKWGKRIYKTSGKARVTFRTVGNDKWTFATDKAKLLKHIKYSQPLSKYTKVRGEYSPYDKNISYWSDRLSKDSNYSIRIQILLRKQKGNCCWCKTLFTYDDILEIDHIIPETKGGSNDFSNFQLLHRHCHDIKTNFD